MLTIRIFPTVVSCVWRRTEIKYQVNVHGISPFLHDVGLAAALLIRPLDLTFAVSRPRTSV